ncbi:MAG: hypothetical protein ACJ8EH_05585 [Sphingomicrobium sp.]
MYRALLLAAALGALAPASPAAQPTSNIRWSIETPGSRFDGHDVQLTIDSRWSPNSRSTWSNDRNLSEIGLSPAQVTGSSQPVRFTFAREAGRLDCIGTAGSGRGSGSCVFTPDAGFASFLAARGIGQPGAQQSFSLAMSGVGRDLVGALEKGGFERPSVEQLTAMGIHGATAPYVRALAGSGYHLSADDLVAFKIHGVEPDYVRQLGAIGPRLQHIGPSDLVALKIHGVRADYVRELAAIGPEFRNLSADDLVAFAIHGVRPALARAYVEANGRRLEPDAVVAMAIHGVTPEFINALAALGYRNLSADDLVALSIHGVTADYVQSLQRAGMPRLSADQLVRLRLAGFDGRKN